MESGRGRVRVRVRGTVKDGTGRGEVVCNRSGHQGTGVEQSGSGRGGVGQSGTGVG